MGSVYGVSVPVWAVWLIVSSMVIGAALFLWRHVLRPLGGKFRTFYKLVELTPVVRQIAEEFSKNGGSSLRDAIDRIEASVLAIGDGQFVLRQQVRASWSMMQIGVGEADATGACIFVNPYWSQITGVPLDRALGNGWINAVHEDDRDEVFEEWRQAVAQHRDFDMNHRYRHPDGRVVEVHARTQQIHDAEGKLLGYVATITPRIAREGHIHHAD